jgi:hypothetical protein
LIHFKGDQSGDINFILFDVSLITISSVGLGFSVIRLLVSDILKLREVAKKSENISPATSDTTPSNGANNGNETS